MRTPLKISERVAFKHLAASFNPYDTELISTRLMTLF